MNKIISINKSIIPACDVNLEKYETIVKETKDIEKVGAYKIGFSLALRYGLPKVVSVAKKYTDKPLIYDHQKAGTDIPFTGEEFAKICKESGLDAVILFPFTGPVTEETWITKCQEYGLGVIVGGHMTHEGFLEDEGGFINTNSSHKIYEIAAKNGVTDFVVPGNKPFYINAYKKAIQCHGIQPILYPPGLVNQGGDITQSGKAAGDKWHAIVGRAIYNAKDIQKTVEKLTKQI